MSFGLDRLGIVFTADPRNGPFQAGAAKALQEWSAQQHVKPRVVVGASMGALSGALFVAGACEELIAQWRTISFWKFASFSLTRLMRFRPPVDLGSLRALFAKHMIGERILASPTNFAIVTLNLTTAKKHVFTSRDRIFSQEPRLMEDAIFAGVCIPVLFSPMTIGGQDFSDGGYLDPQPVRVAAELGPSCILVVGRAVRADPWRGDKGMFDALVRAISAGQARIIELEKPATVPVVHCAPDASLPPVDSVTMFWKKPDYEKIRMMIEHGYEKTYAALMAME